MKQVFKNSRTLVDFLEADEPEGYVFRGQTQSYEGPMLPSGLRDRFLPFKASTGPPEWWSGITMPKSEIDDKVNAKRRGLTKLEGKYINDGKTTWDLPEVAYQMGFRDYFNQPHSQQIRNTSKILLESIIPAIYSLLGEDLGSLLCQQYGLASTALDVSADPSVAMFFATHQAPFYNLVTDSPQLGVVYRWPRERALITKDMLLKLEGLGFKSIVTSFRNFIKDSVSLNIVKDTLVHFFSTTGELHHQKRMMAIVAEGDRRNTGSLLFPVGAFDRSRMGRQRAAILWPDYEIRDLMSHNNQGSIALIGDLLKTHEGEVFYFHHTDYNPTEQLNKFALWPSIRSPSESLTENFQLELRHDHIEFEDLYLEMMLRFFSSCGPCDIVMAELLDPENRKSLNRIGTANGVVDLGYLLHPSDAGLMVDLLRTPEIYMPIPTLRYIPAENVESFQTAFIDAIAS